MNLHELKPAPGSRKKPVRKGRGIGSGLGKTSGRGHKGQNARSGGGVRPGFEGGQMPLQQRVPKRGFTNIFSRQIVEVNVRDLARFESGSTVTPEALLEAGVIKSVKDGIKLLGKGEIDRPLTVKVHAYSKSAADKVNAAGGKVEVI